MDWRCKKKERAKLRNSNEEEEESTEPEENPVQPEPNSESIYSSSYDT